MKIVFLGFASSYTPGMTYQDNLLCNQVIKDGHVVTYLSNPEGFVDGKISYIGPQDIVLSNGLHLIRLPYVNCGIPILTKKLRLFSGVYDILEKEKPDVIFCHNFQYGPILDAAKYKMTHKHVKLYVDIHSDASNSARNYLSLVLLHRLYFKSLIRKVIPFIDKYFYISEDTRKFSIDNYGVPQSIMEYYPLGGTVLTDSEYQRTRSKRRKELGLSDNQLLYLHSGKLGPLKKTKELLSAYSSIDDDSRLIIIGFIPEDMEEEIIPLIRKDKRIQYLGWKTGFELNEYMCASDMYCQPGSASASLQNAICCMCAIMAYPLPQYKVFDGYGNVLWVKDEEDIKKAFLSIKENPEVIHFLRSKSITYAKEHLDYKILASRLYS